jgi:glutamate-1-semialdehyde 2,1-aminomutase
VLGGGFPIGAVGGRKDILELSSPKRSQNPNEVVFHSGTFNGNPISLSAGLKTIQFLQEPGRFEHILHTTNQLKEGIRAIGESYGFGVRVLGIGTIFNFMVSERSKPEEDSAFTPSKDLREALDFLLMRFGVFSKPFNRFSVSAVHGEKEVQHTLDAFERSFSELKRITIHLS